MVADATLWRLQVRDDLADATRRLQQIPKNPKSGRIAKPPHELSEKLVAEGLARENRDGGTRGSFHLFGLYQDNLM